MQRTKDSALAALVGGVPYSQEAEEALIGSVLVDPSAIYTTANIVTADDFYVLRHSYVWEAMTNLSQRREPIDLITLSEELRASGRLADVGGPAFLTAAMNSMPTSMHAEVYARLVERLSIRRRLLLAADQIKGFALDEDRPLEEVMADVYGALRGAGHLRESRLRSIRDVVSKLYDEVENAMSAAEGGLAMLGVPTGLRDIDARFGGLQPSEDIILAGRPGMGKSALAMNICVHAASTLNPKTGKPYVVYYASMEMIAERLAARVVASRTGISTQKLRTGQMGREDWSSFVRQAGDVSRLSLFIDDNPRQTPDKLERTLTQLALEVGLDLVVIDYLQLMEIDGERGKGNREREVSSISRRVKQITLDLNIPVIACAQLNRSVDARDDKRPLLSDLRESGSLEQDADKVLFLYRPIVYYADDPAIDPAAAELIVAKNRDDSTGSINLLYHQRRTQFTDHDGRIGGTR